MAKRTQAKKQKSKAKAPKRRCEGTTKKGQPCRAAALKGKGYCSAHDPDRPASARFGSHEQATAAGVQGGRPAAPRFSAVLRDRFEKVADAILAPYFKALGIELDENAQPVFDGEGRPKLVKGAIVTYKGESTSIEDLSAQIDAAEKLQDRVIGRPKQRTETPDETSSIDAEIEQLLAEMDRRDREAA